MAFGLGTPTLAADKTDRAQGKSTSGKAGADTGMPVLVLVPMVFATDEKLANGCWARLYDKQNFAGNVLVLVGPVDIANTRPASVTGLELGRNYDSVVVGSNATLAVWGDENYRDKTATFKAGQRVADLDRKMGTFEEIKSLKITCEK
jgi:hypothetical protein